MVPKEPPGDWRPCGDYYVLSNVTVPDFCPLPKITNFTSLVEASIFFIIDLIRGYNQIQV